MTEGTASPKCCMSPAVLLGKGLTGVFLLLRLSLLLGLSQNCTFLKILCRSPFFSGKVWSKLFVCLHIWAESSIPAWGLWAGDCPSSAALRAEGKEAELLFVLASFSGVNHQWLGSWGHPGEQSLEGCQGFQWRRQLGCWAMSLAWPEKEKNHTVQSHTPPHGPAPLAASPKSIDPAHHRHLLHSLAAPTPGMCFHPFPALQSHFPGTQTAWPTHWCPYMAFDPGTGSPQTEKRTWISSSTVTNHTTAPEVCKARQGLLPRPLLLW